MVSAYEQQKQRRFAVDYVVHLLSGYLQLETGRMYDEGVQARMIEMAKGETGAQLLQTAIVALEEWNARS